MEILRIPKLEVPMKKGVSIIRQNKKWMYMGNLVAVHPPEFEKEKLKTDPWIYKK